MSDPFNLVVLGLSLSSSWGNGHAVTYRSLLRALSAEGCRITFLERDVSWYAAHRDLTDPDYCELILYKDLEALQAQADRVRGADAVILGSYVPDGAQVAAFLFDTAQGPVAFYDIDTPVTLAALETGGLDYLEAALIPKFDVYFSFTGGPTLERLEQVWGAARARALYCSADPEVHHPAPSEILWDLSYLGTYSSDRQAALERLLIEPARRAPDRRFVVAGPQYPDDIAWPDNVDRIEHVPPPDHAAFYAASRFTLNLTRGDMRKAGYSPSIRLFEAGACGAPIITDAWPGIESLFDPGDEILVADDAAEVLEALSLPEADRLALGGRGRRRVLKSHVAAVRAQQLKAELLAARTLRPPPRRRGEGSRPRAQGPGVSAQGASSASPT